MRQRTKNMVDCIEKAGKCELCGSTKGLEAHHIIPVVVQDYDSPENLLCVCETCHSKLTPSSILTKIGLNKMVPTYGEVLRWDLYKFCKKNHNEIDLHDLLDWLYDDVFPRLDAVEYPAKPIKEVI